jgi:type I restriction-modification system DNA methylase subunit
MSSNIAQEKIMSTNNKAISTSRYGAVPGEKSSGVTYTPKELADFVAQQIAKAAGELPTERPLRVLDPAVGHGELLFNLLGYLTEQPGLTQA